MPNFGVPELLIILGIVVLIFGVGKLPAVGEALGKSIGGFKKAVKDEEPPVAVSAAVEEEGKA
jgi:sec-independent protein translocase protein TatA